MTIHVSRPNKLPRIKSLGKKIHPRFATSTNVSQKCEPSKWKQSKTNKKIFEVIQLFIVIKYATASKES